MSDDTAAYRLEWGDALSDPRPVMTPDSLPAVPNKPKTPLHSFRVDHDLWNAAKKKAREEGTTIADVLRAYLKRYVGKRSAGGAR